MKTDTETLETIAEVIQSSLAVNGQLAFPYYKQFWANLHESPECASCYLAVLLSKLVGLTSGEDKYTPLPDLVLKIVSDKYSISASEVQKLAPDLDPVLLSLRQSILLTLYFIGIHVRFAVKHQPMNLAFAKWIEFNAIQRWHSSKTPFVDEVISILTASFDNPESLVQLIDNATTIDVPMDLCQDLNDARNLSRALLAAWLVRGSSLPLPKLINAVLNVLKKEDLPESRILIALHMLKKLVTHTPYISHADIHNALTLLKTFYLWPRPYGDFTRSVMEILSSEARNPGHTLRSMILHEFPNVLKEQGKPKATRTASQGRLIHMLVDTLHNDGSVMHDLLKSCPADDPHPAQLQIDLLGNILYRVLGTEPDILGIEHCPQELISELLGEALNVMDHAATLPEKDARAYRAQHIKIIGDKIMDNAEFDSYGYPPRHPAPPPFHMSIVQLKCSNTRPKKSDDLTDSQSRIPVRRNCVQALSQIFASYQHQNRAQNGNSSPPNKRHSQKIPNPPNFSVPLQESNTKANRKSPNLQQQQLSPPQPRLVRIAVIGSDTALHNVVTGYVTLRREQPALFVGLDIRFYIIPIANTPSLNITSMLPSPLNTSTSTNHFASFIAKNDPWYYRHIWVGSYTLTSVLPSGSTSLSISQLQDIAQSKSITTQSQSPRVRSKSRALAGPDIDRLASSGSLVESIKAVQKQKFVANSFIGSKGSDADSVGNGRLSTEVKTEALGDKETSTDSPRDHEHRLRTGSAGNKKAEANTSSSSLAYGNPDNTQTNNNNTNSTTFPPNTTANVTSTSTSTVATPSETTTITGATTTTITTNAEGKQEIVISSSSTEVLVLKNSKRSQPNTTSTSSTSATTSTTSISSPTSSTPATSNDSPALNRSSSWTTHDGAAPEGSRRTGSTGSNSSPNRSRSNSGNSDANGIVVGQSRSRSSTNTPPVPNGYSLDRTLSNNGLERIAEDGAKADNSEAARASPVVPPIAISASAVNRKALYRRSNSLSDALHLSSQSRESPPLKPTSTRAPLQHSQSVATFTFDAPSPPAVAESPTSLPLNDSQSSILQAPSPARILRQEFDTFVRDASQFLNVAIFQAECWTVVDNESLYFTVPFLIRAELGVAAYARHFSEANDLPSSLTYQDITSHKLFKYNPVPLSLKCTPVNLNGISRSVQTIDARPYVSISLSNLGPLDKAQQNNANPTRPWLELATVEAETKKKKKEESHTYYVSIVDIETEGKKLVDLLLDGEYYGSVYKLRITTCTAPPISRPPPSSTPTPAPTSLGSSSTLSPPLSTSPPPTEDEQIIFPVMTYLPLNLP